MWFTAILAAVLLAPPSLQDSAEPPRDSSSGTNQDTPTNPQASNPEPAPAAPQQSENAPDQKPQAKEAEADPGKASRPPVQGDRAQAPLKQPQISRAGGRWAAT